MKVFVTGGAGFIGSHTCVELLNAGHEVVVVDNLCNSSKESLKRVKKIAGRSVTFYKADIRDEKKLDKIVKGVLIYWVLFVIVAWVAFFIKDSVPDALIQYGLGGGAVELIVTGAIEIMRDRLSRKEE